MAKEENAIKRHLVSRSEHCNSIKEEFGIKQTLLTQLQRNYVDLLEQIEQFWLHI